MKNPIHRKKGVRLFWNNDGDDLRAVAFGLGQLWTARGMVPLVDRFESIGQFLDLRLGPIAQTPVDAISYCGVFTWPVWDFPRDRIKALGPDPLMPVIDFAHSHRKKFYFNIRLNDAHTSGPHWNGPAYWEPFRLSHPECLQGRISGKVWQESILPWAEGKSPEYPLRAVLDRSGPNAREILSWAAYDYARAEVRDYFLDLIQQACERYDLDGIDLDFLRAPCFFRAGEERRHVPLMDDFVRGASARVRRAAQKRGRPIALCLRVPDAPRRALELGLDVAHWIEEGWLDQLVAGNGLAPFSMPFSPWKKLCDPRGIPVIACLSRNAPSLADPEAFLGACRRLWAQKVSGLYFFNCFIPAEYPAIERGASLRALARESKRYALDTQHSAFENGTVHEGPVPMVFEGTGQGSSATFALEVPQSLWGAKERRLCVRWNGDVDGKAALWTINGRVAPLLKLRDGGQVDYRAEGLRRGENKIRLVIPAGAMGLKARGTLEALSVRIATCLPGDRRGS